MNELQVQLQLQDRQIADDLQLAKPARSRGTVALHPVCQRWSACRHLGGDERAPTVPSSQAARPGEPWGANAVTELQRHVVQHQHEDDARRQLRVQQQQLLRDSMQEKVKRIDDDQ